MAYSSVGIHHVILTGPPGVGKTTLVQKACQLLKVKEIQLHGFYTEEKRDRGKRTGFDVVTLDGHRGPLAIIEDGSPSSSQSWQSCRVGQYTVLVREFENLAVPALACKNNDKAVCVIDEIGKMELFSQNFVKAVKNLLENGNVATLFATIPIKQRHAIPFVEDIRSRKDIKLFEISKENRNSVLDEITQAIEAAYKSRGNTS